MKRHDLEILTPREIVRELDAFIIGQEQAKKIIAIALRNRIRRQKLSKELREEVAPKNIIMIGPTGVGKTEIARRISKLTGAPFIKVEATKYTEVGYVGRDVESMVRDLMSVAISMTRTELYDQVRPEAERRAEDVLLDLLLPGIGAESISPMEGTPTGTGEKAGILVSVHQQEDIESPSGQQEESTAPNPARERFRRLLREGSLDDKKIEIMVTRKNTPSVEVFSGASFEEMDVNIGNIANLFGNRQKKRGTTVKHAREIIIQQEADKLLDADQISEIARESVEQMGIIFIDEIDKIAARSGREGIDVSRGGVQRDILPIVEGSKINTRYGMIDTSHILFIAAGSFHSSKPSDLIPELQGRFPLRVELKALSSEDFHKILTQPKNALIRQYCELMNTEGVELDFKDEAVLEISRIAFEANNKNENIGARRLHTVMELLLEEISFSASELKGQTIKIDSQYVRERLDDVLQDDDLSKYIL